MFTNGSLAFGCSRELAKTLTCGSHCVSWSHCLWGIWVGHLASCVSAARPQLQGPCLPPCHLPSRARGHSDPSGSCPGFRLPGFLLLYQCVPCQHLQRLRGQSCASPRPHPHSHCFSFQALSHLLRHFMLFHLWEINPEPHRPHSHRQQIILLLLRAEGPLGAKPEKGLRPRTPGLQSFTA